MKDRDNVMQYTPEQLTKAKQAKSAEELLAMAKASGIAMSADESAKYFAELNKHGELSDDELNSVAGGKDEEEEERPAPKYQVGQKLKRKNQNRIRAEGCTITACEWYRDKYYYDILYDDGEATFINEEALQDHFV